MQRAACEPGPALVARPHQRVTLCLWVRLDQRHYVLSCAARAAGDASSEWALLPECSLVEQCWDLFAVELALGHAPEGAQR